MIEARELTKRYGDHLAVDDLTFTVRPGLVTGFLGPNGSGKSTTMRMILGLDRPTAGSVLVNGREFARHTAPLHEVGALLEARAVHTGRTARNHLRVMAATSGIGRDRVEQVIDMVGLGGVANQRVGGFSLGMGQRLGVAAALLGDPQTLILDEPINGLDLQGIRWMRSLLTSLAAEGRTVFLSSHLMSEMALTADHVIVVGRGRLLRDQSMSSFIDDASVETVRVRAPRAAELTRLASSTRGRGRPRRRRRAHRLGHVQRHDRHPGGQGPDHPLRAGPERGVPGGRLPGADQGRRGLPGPDDEQSRDRAVAGGAA